MHVLAYHALRDLSHDRVLRPFGVPLHDLDAQLTTLRDAGYTFVSGDALVGDAPPDRSVLVTFDDAFLDLLDALPVLQAHGVPAIVFVVTSLVGATNEWDAAPGREPLPLLDVEGLRAVHTAGVEIGAHSRTHAHLPGVDDAAVRSEIDGSLDDLEALGFPRPRAFAYPFAEHDARVRAAVGAAGIELAFTVEQAAVPLGCDRLAIPRIEPRPGESGRRLLRKLRRARTRS